MTLSVNNYKLLMMLSKILVCSKNERFMFSLISIKKQRSCDYTDLYCLIAGSPLFASPLPLPLPFSFTFTKGSCLGDGAC